MKPEDKVTSQPLSARMHNLGWRHKTERWWCKFEYRIYWQILSELKMKEYIKNITGIYPAPDAIEIVLPKEAYICQKALWCGDKKIDINHIDNDLDKPLNISEAKGEMWCYLRENKLI